jgi:hypothetical protein
MMLPVARLAQARQRTFTHQDRHTLSATGMHFHRERQDDSRPPQVARSVACTGDTHTQNACGYLYEKKKK